jgi:hypothetical protein
VSPSGVPCSTDSSTKLARTIIAPSICHISSALGHLTLSTIRTGSVEKDTHIGTSS